MSKAETRLPQRLKLFHGFGAVAFGIKDNGFSVFLLIYYNQVLGMDAGVVSAALAMALIIDAFIDPLLGNLSDRTYTRWGRRLPWLYSAALPLAFAWVLLWSPPGGGTPSFWELLGLAVVVRMLLSACEVPSVSLVPELTRDYDERTTLFRYRYLFGWTGGLLMLFLAYNVFLAGGGMLHRPGYVHFGIAGAIMMVISVVLSAMGQHSRVAHLPPERPPPFSLRVAFREIREAFSERAFLILAGGAVAAYASQGMTFAISNYLYLFVWRFSQSAFFVYTLVLFASVVLAFVTIGTLHKRYGKPRTAWVAALVAVTLWIIPYGARLLGLWPVAGTAMSTGSLFGFIVIGNCAAVIVAISASSMVAEIVEAFEERTGRRAEGSFYAGNWFAQKCATGLGIFLTGQIVAFSGMPKGATPGSVSEGVLDTLTIAYCALIVLLGLSAAFWLARFPITRADHEARLRSLDAAALADPDGSGMVP